MYFEMLQKAVFDVLYKIADLPFLGDHKVKVLVSISECLSVSFFHLACM